MAGRMTGPHDRFFRYIFNPPVRAEALLRHNLPVDLATEVDWASLRRESGTLVDWQRETRQDLLFSARCSPSGEDGPPHYFLIEHQSSVEWWMALRLHDYASRLIHHWREVHPGSRWIPEVTALVVYPRQGRRWSAPLRLEDHYRERPLVTGRKRRRWALRFEYRVDDLSTQSEQVIRGRPGPPLVPLGLLVLCFAGSGQLTRMLPHWSELFARVYESANGPQALYRVVRYLHELGDTQVHEAVRGVLHSFMESKPAEALMQTMAQMLREQGRQTGLVEGEARGEARGEAKGLARALLRLLAARGLAVDEAARKHIQGCMEVPTLEQWLDRAVTASHISQVLDGPAQ
jgi:predicted transposase YdaD